MNYTITAHCAASHCSLHFSWYGCQLYHCCCLLSAVELLVEYWIFFHCYLSNVVTTSTAVATYYHCQSIISFCIYIFFAIAWQLIAHYTGCFVCAGPASNAVVAACQFCWLLLPPFAGCYINIFSLSSLLWQSLIACCSVTAVLTACHLLLSQHH